MNVAPPKKSNNGLIFGLIGLVVVALAAVAVWFFVLNKPGVGSGPSPNDNTAAGRETKAASILPRKTLAYVSVATDLEGSQKAAFDKLGQAFPNVQQALGQMGGSSGQTNQMAQDIQAILSKYTKQVSLAVLPPSTSDWEAVKSGGQAAIADVAMRNIVGLADMDLAALKKDAPNSEVADTYNGVEVTRVVSGTAVFYAAPLDGSTVAVAIRPEPVRGMIDQVKNKQENIRDDDTYKYLSGLVPEDRVAALYLNLTDLYNQIETVAPGTLKQSGIESMSGAFLLTVSGKETGLQIDLATQADVKSSFTNQIASAGKPDSSTINDIPADSFGFLVGTDLKSVLLSALESMKAAAQQAGQQDPVAQVEAQVKAMTGLSLQNDIIPLLGGDYALSVSPGSSSAGGMAIPNVLFQLKLNGGDRDKAADALSKVMQALGRGQIQTFDSGGGTFYDLTDMGMAGLAVGVGKDRLMVVYDSGGQLAPAVDQAANNVGKGFGTGAKWDEAKNNLPKDSNAIMYVDLDAIKAAYGSGMPSEVEPYLRPFKYVIIGSATQSGGANRGLSRIFFGISK